MVNVSTGGLHCAAAIYGNDLDIASALGAFASPRSINQNAVHELRRIANEMSAVPPTKKP